MEFHLEDKVAKLEAEVKALFSALLNHVHPNDNEKLVIVPAETPSSPVTEPVKAAEAPAPEVPTPPVV